MDSHQRNLVNVMKNLSMLANAMNNFHKGPANTVYYPRATIEKYGDSMLPTYTKVAVEDVPREDLRAAMDAYRANTDWSAFKRKDWDAAYATL
ncbi:hypothetical protein P9A47_gp28 [Xanthomonas phage Elanor]|uniref:Uncharacterized protein n=1 Tax=Xanthomonas phage Elanor TaxID=2939127 RepID=A0A9E7E180_9CAUD|nr:hypothetical protein P9A47_gp28 [Xanthomonas phage Elanor]URA06996.1 hypothetical protein Elanor_BL40028 [Xanthomonas phage Elanor]